MKAYKIFYNEKTKLLDLMEFDISDEFDFSHDPDSNMDEENHSHCCVKESMEEDVNRLNEQIKSGSLQIRRCKDCGGYFSANEQFRHWYKYRGLDVPKRCGKCRELRRRGG